MAADHEALKSLSIAVRRLCEAALLKHYHGSDGSVEEQITEAIKHTEDAMRSVGLILSRPGLD